MIKFCINRDFLNQLIKILFVVELLFMLFPAWSGSPVWKLITLEQYFQLVNIAGVVFLLFAIIIISIVQRVNRRNLYLLIVLEFVFLISLSMTGFKSGWLALLGIPISYIVLFDLLKNLACQRRLLAITTYIILLWCILPILFLPVASLDQRVLFFTTVEGQISTFSGFALHRNFYGMVLGMAFILLLKQKHLFHFFVSFSLLVLLCIGTFLSASRSTLVSVAIVLFYDYFLLSRKVFLRRIPIMLLSIILFWAGYYMYNQYSLRVENDNDGRIELYQGFVSSINKHLIWGYGEPVRYYSERYQEGSPAHNFIVQLWADYGLIVLLVYLFFLAYCFFKIHHNARAFLLYVMIWGVFQPYFGFGIPTAQVCVPLMIGYFLDSNDNKSTLK